MDYKEHLIRLEEEFEMALDEGDYMQCNRLISEVDEAGHREIALKMVERVEQAPVIRFANTASPYGVA